MGTPSASFTPVSSHFVDLAKIYSITVDALHGGSFMAWLAWGIMCALVLASILVLTARGHDLDPFTQAGLTKLHPDQVRTATIVSNATNFHEGVVMLQFV